MKILNRKNAKVTDKELSVMDNCIKQAMATGNPIQKAIGRGIAYTVKRTPKGLTIGITRGELYASGSGCYQWHKSRVLLQGTELNLSHEAAIMKIVREIDGSTTPWDYIQQVPDNDREITAMLDLAKVTEIQYIA